MLINIPSRNLLHSEQAITICLDCDTCTALGPWGSLLAPDLSGNNEHFSRAPSTHSMFKLHFHTFKKLHQGSLKNRMNIIQTSPPFPVFACLQTHAYGWLGRSMLCQRWTAYQVTFMIFLILQCWRIPFCSSGCLRNSGFVSEEKNVTAHKK